MTAPAAGWNQPAHFKDEDKMKTKSPAHPPVVLVQMPFGMTTMPSLGLSLLKASLSRATLGCTVLYMNVLFQKIIGKESYGSIALDSGVPNLIGEWVFTEALFGASHERDSSYMRQLINDEDSACRRQALQAREKVGSFLDRCIAAYDWSTARMVGFTSMCQQHIPSLSLAKRLKQMFPHLYIVFGGACCEGDMGQATLELFPFVDAVCSGEADATFPAFVQAKLLGQSPHIPGFTERMPDSRPDSAPAGPPQPTPPPPAALESLDALPYPDFDDYFECLDELEMPVSEMLPFETSRGCWWGQKNQCTFCGLNGQRISYRAKSGGRALAELQELLNRYGSRISRLQASDCIMPYTYLKSVVPELANLKPKKTFFYETKANLTERDIATCSRARIKQIQPGIESLNSTTLRLMRKGVSAIQNIQLLKWCSQYGVFPSWNLLFGFPGETPDIYLEQIETIQKVRHLTAPVACGPVRFDRFSRYHSNPQQFGITKLSPHPVYELIYSGIAKEDVQRLAYHFGGEYDSKQYLNLYGAELISLIRVWREQGQGVTLCHSGDGSTVTVFDTRDGVRLLRLEGVSKSVFDHCSTAMPRRKVVEAAVSEGHSEKAVEGAIDDLLAQSLLIGDEERLLTISIPLGFAYKMPADVRTRFSGRQLRVVTMH
jgi:ribosomal peptide maturation radical SAM protein 1